MSSMKSRLQKRGSKRKRTQTEVFDPNEYNGYDEDGNKDEQHYHNNPYDRDFDYTAVGKGLKAENEENRIIELEMRDKETTKEGYAKDKFIVSDDESEEECSDDESEEECSDDESEEECSDEESEEECSDEESEYECSDDDREEKLININVYNIFIN